MSNRIPDLDKLEPVDPNDPSFITRRAFAGLGSLALLGALLPSGLVPNLGPLGGATGEAARLSGRVVSQKKEDLPDGGARTTTVIEINNTPGSGWSGHETVVRTDLRTANGDVVDYETSFSPAAMTMGNKANVGHIHVRMEFTHGHATAEGRQDTMTFSGEIDGKPFKTITRQVIRPSHPLPDFAGLTSEQQLQKALEIVNSGGSLHELPGRMQILDPNLDELKSK